MPFPLSRAALLLMMAGAVALRQAAPALAQPAPQPQPQPQPSRPAPPHGAAPPGKPAIHPAPRTPVQRTPLVQPKPGAPGHPPGKPADKPGAPKPAPAPAPAAGPAPAPPPATPPEQTKGSNTGNPLPRFASLRTDEVNFRAGPGARYPIDWVYKRRDLPVLIEREFELWRLVRDPDGTKGWVHQATLAPRRSGVILGGEHALRRDPQDAAAAVARLKPGVIVRLRSCEATSDWCQAQVGDYRGWIRRTEIWGTFPAEAIQ